MNNDFSGGFDAEVQDTIPTSPGTLLHYFACLNYVDGVKTLLDDPYRVYHSKLNKNGLTPLWIASWYNNTRIGRPYLFACLNFCFKRPLLFSHFAAPERCQCQ